MKKYRKQSTIDEAGLLSFDFLAGFTIFMIAFIMVVTLVSGLFIGLQSKTIDHDAVAYRTGVILAEDPGAAISKVGVSPVAPDTFSWELIPSAYQNSHILRMGLSLPKYYYDTPSNVWLENKNMKFFSSFANNDFYRNKLIFGNYPYRLNISLNPEGSASSYLGENPPDSGYYGYIKRVGMIKYPSSIDSDLSDHLDPETLTDVGGSDRKITYQFRDFYVRDPAYQVYPQIETTSINFVSLPPMTNDPKITAVKICYPSCDDAIVPEQAYVEVDGVKDSSLPFELTKSSIVLMGGKSGGIYLNDVWRSTDNGASWKLKTAGAEWTVRAGHTSMTLPDGSIVLAGGENSGIYNNEVWRSTDSGASWSQVNPSSDWSARAYHSCVVKNDGSMILAGGYDGSSYKNDVWKSTDYGKTWVQMKPNDAVGWPGRAGHSAVLMPDNSIVLMGGLDSSGYYNDVWRSMDDGSTWIRMKPNDAIGWSARAYHSAVSMPDGYIVLMGGENGIGYKNDVWKSANYGAVWMEVKPDDMSGWSGRSSQSAGLVRVPDVGIVVMGGKNAGGSLNDVWLSDPRSSGTTWTELTSAADWSARSGHTTVVLPDADNVLFITPQMFQNIPSIGPISDFDITVTFDTPDARGIDHYDPLSQREFQGVYRSVFHEPPLVPATLEVKVW